MGISLHTVHKLLVGLVLYGMVLTLISFFFGFVRTRDIDAEDHTVSYYNSHMTSFCIDTETEYLKHTCVYYSGNEGFFANLPHFTHNSSTWLGATVVTSFGILFTCIFLIVELYGIFSEDPNSGAQKNILSVYNKIGDVIKFLPNISEKVMIYIWGIGMSVINAIFYVIAFIIVISAIANTSFDETANLTNYDKMLHAGFFLYLFGFVCTLGGMIGSTLAKIFAEKVDSTPSYSEPNPNFDNVESI